MQEGQACPNAHNPSTFPFDGCLVIDVSNLIDHPNQYHKEEPINYIESNRVNDLERHEVRIRMKQYVTVALFLHMLVEGTQTNV